VKENFMAGQRAERTGNKVVKRGKGLIQAAALLKALREDSGVAIVVIQQTGTGRIFSSATEVPVDQATGGIAIEPNHFYVVSSLADLSIRGGILRLLEREELLYQQELQALTAKLISAQEASSKHLARELHDVFGQKLGVLGMEISALGKRPAKSAAARDDRLRQIAGQIGVMAKDIHQMSRQLHPAILDDLGLAAALKGECLAFAEQNGIPVKFTPRKVPGTIPEAVSLCLYRVAQESLRNIGKHSAATEVRVSLTGSGREIVLVIEDVGDGFELAEAKGKGGLGLVSMDERVRLVDGTFSIRSEPKAGTRVEVRVPLRGREG
jgi:signal transduction histidine kinase